MTITVSTFERAVTLDLRGHHDFEVVKPRMGEPSKRFTMRVRRVTIVRGIGVVPDDRPGREGLRVEVRGPKVRESGALSATWYDATFYDLSVIGFERIPDALLALADEHLPPTA